MMQPSFGVVVRGLALTLLLLPSSCDQDECEDGFSACSGDKVLFCDKKYSENYAPNVIREEPCPENLHCVVSAHAGAFCALDTKPDPRCAALGDPLPNGEPGTPAYVYPGEPGYCENSQTTVQCQEEFRIGVGTCPNDSPCVSTGPFAQCPSPVVPPLVCGSETCDPKSAGTGLGDCCTTDQRCGGDLAPLQKLLGLPSNRLCVARHQPGTLDDTCPAECVWNVNCAATCLWTGSFSFRGCRRPDGTCGISADSAATFNLSFGCIDPGDFGITPGTQSCSPKGSDAGAGDAGSGRGADAGSG
jgi:hypothetical protein